jgi:uncharacterized Rossmann fold enzyme
MTDMVKEPDSGPKWDGTIRLANPMKQNYEAFIVGNATMCDEVVKQDEAKGQTIVICGAGPSLRDHAEKWTARGDQVWGCNSAAIWLYEQGYPVTHAFTVDQTPHMVEEWLSAPPLEYLVASTVHPHLPQLLKARERRFRFFHNFVLIQKPPVRYCECGHDHPVEGDEALPQCEHCDCTEWRPKVMHYEEWLYHTLYEPTVVTGSGLNSTTRAIDLARFMGAKEIILLGADCAIKVNKPRPPKAFVGSSAHLNWLKQHTVMHADGSDPTRSGATAVTLEGEIDGRVWLSKPDMLITAVHLERMRRELGRKQLRIIGDTLPNALQGKDEEFLKRMPHFEEGPDEEEAASAS